MVTVQMQSGRVVLFGNENDLLLIKYDEMLGRVEVSLDSTSDLITIFNGIKNEELLCVSYQNTPIISEKSALFSLDSASPKSASALVSAPLERRLNQ